MVTDKIFKKNLEHYWQPCFGLLVMFILSFIAKGIAYSVLSDADAGFK